MGLSVEIQREGGGVLLISRKTQSENEQQVARTELNLLQFNVTLNNTFHLWLLQVPSLESHKYLQVC